MQSSIVNQSPKLFTPGPTNIPPSVALASAFTGLHHRTAEFSKILEETLLSLKKLFNTSGYVLPVHTTGRGALEGVYTNLLSGNDLVLCICNGKFGEMALNTLKKIGIPTETIFDNWTDSVNIADLEEHIKAIRPTALVAVHSDTSNGMANPIEEIGLLCKKYDILFIVDAVSSVGCMPFYFEKWNVDAAVVASQKGLMSPTGISFVALSENAVGICRQKKCRDYYINFSDIIAELDGGMQTPGSTPVSLVAAVHEALSMIVEEGIENTFARHRRLSLATKCAIEKMGFELFPKNCDARSDSLTVVSVPPEIQTKKLIQHLKSEYSTSVASGLDASATSTIRIAHMGFCNLSDMLSCIINLEAALLDLGYSDTMGKGAKCFAEEYQRLKKAEME